ncbi:UDP-glycosyltransferase 86a1 [Phtheirospermum japonicum]|uniref:Glycosyltransferase n=1 Tax=Phtheirospermum japonicum TaxID=374723 RepID=A0A830B7T4_9LAMI|nr:UDP-glycosyltransferase 86a1 [Phtheirospermum japonicum]
MANLKPHAIVFPYPYQGHVTPMINLSMKLASNGFTITFVQNEFIHHSISKANHLPTTEGDIFAQARKTGLDIRYMTISDGFPLEFDRFLNYDQYWETMFRDFPARVDVIITRIIEAEELSVRPHFFLIADTFYSWPAAIAKNHNLVNVSLWTEPAIVFSINYHLDLLRHNGHFPFFFENISGDGNECINYVPGVDSIRTTDLMSYIQDPDMIPMLIQVVMKGFEQVKEADFILSNTVEELESTESTNTIISKSLWPESDCTHWLDSKPPSSVLYISFGSIAQSNKQEIGEFAHGILLSKVYFIWILRPDVVEETEIDILPTGFEDAIKDQGLIVPWSDQNAVLSSPAVGGFLTHCGWNSILESIWYGVPMICYPFIVDQPTNRKLVVDYCKIGINLCEGERVTRDEVANKIIVVMNEQKSAEMKREIEKVSKKLRDSLDAEGSSRRNFNQFVEDLKAKLLSKRSKGECTFSPN